MHCIVGRQGHLLAQDQHQAHGSQCAHRDGRHAVAQEVAGGFLEAFRRADLDERARFIAELERHYGGTYNPETLKVEAKKDHSLEPFQKVLARGNIFSNNAGKWKATFFSHKIIGAIGPLYECGAGCYKECIPYNDETKHLIGTENPYNKTESND